MLTWSFQITPVNIAYLIGAAALLSLSTWSISGYKKSHSALTKYLALSGLMGGMYFLANSLPFMLTTNLHILRFADSIGALAFYATILVQTKLLWYLALEGQEGYYTLLLPVLFLCCIGFLVSVNTVWNADVSIQNGVLHYDTPGALLRLDALLDTLFILVGVYVLRIGRTLKNIKGKLRIFALSLAYITGGIIGIYNALFVHAANSSPSVFIVYVLVFGLLLVVSLIARIQNLS